MQVEMISIQDIKPYEKNAKKHPEEQIKFISNSIEKFGFQQPIVVDKDNVIIIGHGRFLAAKQLGMTEVPVVHADGLTKKQVQALRIADNKTNEKGSWDEKLLGEELKGLLDEMSMTDFGFGDFELEILTGDFKPEPFDDDLEEYAQNDTRSRSACKSSERSTHRSKTFPGIAKAIAEQWSKYLGGYDDNGQDA